MKKVNDNYFADRNSKNIEALREILTTLPPFCKDFFVSIEQTSSPLTRLNYARDLRLFFDYLVKYCSYFDKKAVISITPIDMDNITVNDINYYMSYTSNYIENGRNYTNSERGKARKLSSIKALFKFLYLNDYISANVASKVSHPKLHSKEIIRLSDDEMYGIFDVIKSYNALYSEHQNRYNVHTKTRDLAIITLLLGTGIRVSECVGLNVDDLDMDSNEFVVTRKGGNCTTLYFSDEVKEVLKDYLTFRGVREDTKALFLSLQNNRITVRAVEYLVKKYAKIISPLKKITPHKLRSTFGTNLYKETRDIYVVAEVLGHKDINTTKKHYAATSIDIKREAADKVHLSRKKPE